MEDRVIDSEPSLIKPQITWASPQEVMDWLSTTSLDSLSFDDLAQCLVRFSTLLVSAEMQTLSDVSDLQHASPSRVLQQCLGLVPALGKSFLALAYDSCGTTAVTHSKPERPCQHTITSKTDEIWKCEACGQKNFGSQSVCSHRACSQRRFVVPASSDTVPESAVAKDMIDGLRVRTAFAGVVQVYTAAVQHCYADCTQQIAREVCSRCKDALSCMTARVTCTLTVVLPRGAPTSITNQTGIARTCTPCTSKAWHVTMACLSTISLPRRPSAHPTCNDLAYFSVMQCGVF